MYFNSGGSYTPSAISPFLGGTRLKKLHYLFPKSSFFSSCGAKKRSVETTRTGGRGGTNYACGQGPGWWGCQPPARSRRDWDEQPWSEAPLGESAPFAQTCLSLRHATYCCRYTSRGFSCFETRDKNAAQTGRSRYDPQLFYGPLLSLWCSASAAATAGSFRDPLVLRLLFIIVTFFLFSWDPRSEYLHIYGGLSHSFSAIFKSPISSPPDSSWSERRRCSTSHPSGISAVGSCCLWEGGESGSERLM